MQSVHIYELQFHSKTNPTTIHINKILHSQGTYCFHHWTIRILQTLVTALPWNRPLEYSLTLLFLPHLNTTTNSISFQKWFTICLYLMQMHLWKDDIELFCKDISVNFAHHSKKSNSWIAKIRNKSNMLFLLIFCAKWKEEATRNLENVECSCMATSSAHDAGITKRNAGCTQRIAM